LVLLVRLLVVIIAMHAMLFSNPLWINNQTMDGYITGIGLSNDKDPVSKRIIATASARANLAESIKVEVKSHFKMLTQTHNDTHTTMTESIIKQKANEFLVGSFVKDTFQADDGTLYILVVIKKSDMK